MDQSDKIANMFNINNFYDNNHLNVIKLKQKIIEAKRKLLFDKDKDKQKDNNNKDNNNSKNGTIGSNRGNNMKEKLDRSYKQAGQKYNK